MVKVGKGPGKSCMGRTLAEAEGPDGDKGLSLGALCRQLHFTSGFEFQLCWPCCVVTLCASDRRRGRRKPLSDPPGGCGRPAPSSKRHLVPAGSSV